MFFLCGDGFNSPQNQFQIKRNRLKFMKLWQRISLSSLTKKETFFARFPRLSELFSFILFLFTVFNSNELPLMRVLPYVRNTFNGAIELAIFTTGRRHRGVIPFDRKVNQPATDTYWKYIHTLQSVPAAFSKSTYCLYHLYESCLVVR